MKLLILGAGPTGLGAAWRARELGCDDVVLLEASDRPGGLAGSFRDEVGFTWDQGIHLQFSHYQKYDEFLDTVIPEEDWLWHERRSAAWLHGRYVPYPVQLHLHHLPPTSQWKCLCGLLDAHAASGRAPANFREWINRTFGDGLAGEFLVPYNEKIWATSCEALNATWVGERVAVPDLREVLRRLCLDEDQHHWGPNARYRYPRWGGTGRIWNEAARHVSDQLFYHQRAIEVDPDAKTVTTSRGDTFDYDALISTIPLDVLARILTSRHGMPSPLSLRHTRTHIVGLGLRGPQPESLRELIWVYFSQPELRFYRLTLLSNLTPEMVPVGGGMWSLAVEIAYPPDEDLPQIDLFQEIERDLRELRIIPEGTSVISRWQRLLPHGYPVPTLDRDSVLGEILPILESHDIYSRGRFGAWKYEVSNQDHSYMQGVEAIDRILLDRPELTLSHPDLVNGRQNDFPYPEWRTLDADERLARPSSMVVTQTAF